MTVGEAKNIARQWVEEHKGEIEGFHGAYFMGSINFKPEDEIMSASSDVDICTVLKDRNPGEIHWHNVNYHGVILNTAYQSLESLNMPEQMLSSSYRGYHFSVPCIISDPSGHLTKIQKAVAKEFPKGKWVHKRCDDALAMAEGFLNGCIKENLEFFDRYFWMLPSIPWMADLPIIADLGVPTLRKWASRFHEVLEKYNRQNLYGKFLELIGVAQLNRIQTETICSGMAKAFDKATQIIQTPVAFDFNISEASRPYTVGGSFQLIEQGHYREAVPFILWVYYTSIRVIQNDAPENEKARYMLSYQKAMDTLGFTSEKIIIDRAKKLKEELIPEIMEVAEYIIENNPNIIK